MVPVTISQTGSYAFAVPNGGKRDAKTGARMKYEGAVRGVADLICSYPKGMGFPLYRDEDTEGYTERAPTNVADRSREIPTSMLSAIHYKSS